MQNRTIKKIYWATAVVILLAAFGVTGFFVYSGIKAKHSSTQAAESESKADTQSTPAKDVISGYSLLISKINVSAPLTTDVDGNNKDEYNKSLENGVSHLKGSALPGKSGNAFIFGHSSFAADKPGNYKQIFARLNDLIPGDLIEIQGPSANYVYRLTQKRIVEPSDVSVAEQNFNLKQVTLMTCWPVGSTAQRLVVTGELVEN